VKDLNTTRPENRNGIYPAGAATVGGIVYFVDDDGASGAELWRSDGTAAGGKLNPEGSNCASPSNTRSVYGG
jgi:ELWxxDGT repeat protein